MRTTFIEVLEGRRLLSATLPVCAADSSHAAAAVKVAAKPSQVTVNPAGKYAGQYTYTKPRSSVSPPLWAIITKRANGTLAVQIGSYHSFQYQMNGTWNAKARAVASSYAKAGVTFRISDTLSTSGKKISGTFLQTIRGKTYAGTFTLDKVTYDPR